MSAGAAAAVRVGLIADTHGLFRPSIVRVFADVALIVHAGDVGAAAVLEQLSAMAPTEAVFGNVDDARNPALAPSRTIPIGGLTLHVSHGHEFGSPSPAKLLSAYDADIIVFGHTHRAIVVSERRGGRRILVVNPGAAGPRRFDLRPSVAILTVSGGRAEAEIVELE
jgi:putative phosphoesterase